jgi:hypothetical protein
VFSCGWCGEEVSICRACDRGQRYCTRLCSQAARRTSVREAGRRYAQKEVGRLGNARRQREHYHRQRLENQDSVVEAAGVLDPQNQKNQKNLTHQGSSRPRFCPTLLVQTAPADPSSPLRWPASDPEAPMDRFERPFRPSVFGVPSRRCHFCGRVFAIEPAGIP